MILIFGGTTEGKQVIEVLQQLRLPHIYSTKTEIDVVLDECGKYRHGAFSSRRLEKFIKENNITMIIHASHPFATELHQTISLASKNCKIPVFRLERQFPKRQIKDTIHYVEGYEEALVLMNERYPQKNLLALTGVQSIVKLTSYWKNNLNYFRILDRQSSIDIALENKFPENRLILGYPSKTVEDEVENIRAYNVDVILTKESGESGSLSLKIEAAKKCNTPIIILKKPSLPSEFILIKNKLELGEALKEFNSILEMF